MSYKLVKKRTTPKELGVKGETTGDFLLDLQKKLPTSLSDTILPNGTNISLGRSKFEIKLSKNKEISTGIVEKILTEGTKLLLEENRRRDICNKDRIKITMSLGDNTVYFAQGHLDKLPDGTVMPMYPVLQRTDDTFVRVIDSNFTSDMSSLGIYLREQHNRTLGRREEDRTQEIAEKLGFVTVEKDDSIIDVNINGVIDSCMVTRLCIHSNEFQEEEKLLESIIKTYRDIQGLEENPLVIIGLNDSIDVTISRDRKIITLEYQHDRAFEIITKLVNTVVGFILTKDDLENINVAYKENVLVEGESLGYRIYEKICKVIGAIDKIRERHEHEIVFGMTLITIPLIFLFFLYSKTNPTNSYFQATIATIPSVVFAVIVTREYRKISWIKTFGQKKFPAFIWFWSIVSYIGIRSFGFNAYLMTIFFTTIFSIGIIVVIESLYVLKMLSPLIGRAFSPIVRLLSPVTQRLTSDKSKSKTKVKKSSIFQSKTVKKIVEKLGDVFSNMLNSYVVKKIWMIISIIFRVITAIIGIVAVTIFAIAFLPMMGLFVIVNFLNRGYWRELEKYREDIIEKAVHKYRDERKLAPSCRVIFKTTKCKMLKNPLSGSLNVLRKKVPRLLTAEGFTDTVEKLVLREWM